MTPYDVKYKEAQDVRWVWLGFGSSPEMTGYVCDDFSAQIPNHYT